jgi:hypothetical protein
MTHTAYVVDGEQGTLSVIAPATPTTLTTPSVSVVSSLLSLSVRFTATLGQFG